MSMIGRTMLRCIDLRLREVNPLNRDVPFGGMSICLFGDFGQLPPVMDTHMFDTSKKKGSLSNDGRLSFKAFDKAIILTSVERVQGSDPQQQQFKDLLLHLRNGRVTSEDGRLLLARHHTNLLEEERNTFKDAIFLVY